MMKILINAMGNIEYLTFRYCFFIWWRQVLNNELINVIRFLVLSYFVVIFIVTIVKFQNRIFEKA